MAVRGEDAKPFTMVVGLTGAGCDSHLAPNTCAQGIVDIQLSFGAAGALKRNVKPVFSQHESVE